MFCRICAFVSALIGFNHTTASGMTPTAATGIRRRGAPMHHLEDITSTSGMRIAGEHALNAMRRPYGSAMHPLGPPETSLQCSVPAPVRVRHALNR